MDINQFKFGYFSSPHYILFCNKITSTLSLYYYTKNSLTHIITFNNIILGKLGDKKKEGDLITPIGTYILTRKITPPPFYGPLAFILNYPNIYDYYLKKSGHGIWIHGKPLNNEKRPKNSKGCIVLDNKDLLKLSSLIDYKKTILHISEVPLYANKKDIKYLLKFVTKHYSTPLQILPYQNYQVKTIYEVKLKHHTLFFEKDYQKDKFKLILSK